MFDHINLNISRYVSFSSEELSAFNALLEIKSVPKKTMLLQAGEKCNFEAYVNKGCVRKYFIDAQGSEMLLQFGVEDNWIGDISFNPYDDQPGNVFIETLEDCELLYFTLETKEELLNRYPKFERAFRILVQRSLAATQNRLFDQTSKTATQKYLDFIEAYPSLPNRVAQHYIASYLGISAEFLSKIRTRLLKT